MLPFSGQSRRFDIGVATATRFCPCLSAASASFCAQSIPVETRRSMIPARVAEFKPFRSASSGMSSAPALYGSKKRILGVQFCQVEKWILSSFIFHITSNNRFHFIVKGLCCLFTEMHLHGVSCICNLRVKLAAPAPCFCFIVFSTISAFPPYRNEPTGKNVLTTNSDNKGQNISQLISGGNFFTYYFFLYNSGCFGYQRGLKPL